MQKKIDTIFFLSRFEHAKSKLVYSPVRAGLAGFRVTFRLAGKYSLSPIPPESKMVPPATPNRTA